MARHPLPLAILIPALAAGVAGALAGCEYIAMLETKMRQAKDPVLKADLEAQIADFRRRTRRAAPPPLPAAVAKNAELLFRYREGLAAAQAPATVPGVLRATGERKEAWSRH